MEGVRADRRQVLDEPLPEDQLVDRQDPLAPRAEPPAVSPPRPEWASAAHLAAIVESSEDAIYSKTLDGVVRSWNASAERLYGYCAHEIVGKRASILVPPACPQQAWDLEQPQLGAGSGPFETVRVRKDGSNVDVALRLSPVKDETGTIVGVSVIARDITERLRAERRRNVRLAVTQILTQQGTIQEAVSQVLQAVCENLIWDVGGFWKVDRDAQVMRCAEVWRRPPAQVEEFVAVSLQRAFEPGIGLPGRIWASGKPAWIPDVVNDENFPRATVAAWVGLHAAFGYPIALGGEVLGVMEFFSGEIREPDADLLELMATIGGQLGQFLDRRQADQALRESEQRFAGFMEHLPGLAWIKDREGRYRYANTAAAKAFRKPPAELFGKTDDEVFPPETAAQFKENDRRALASGTGVQVIETLEDEEGVVRYSLVSKFPISGPDGTASLVGGMAIDMTERMRAEEALEQAGRRKDEFLAVLAHELRNPLAPIQNALHILGMPNLDDELARQATSIAQRQVEHLTRLVDDLLDVSRIAHGKIELRMEPLELAAVIARAVETVQPLMDSSAHELTVSLPNDPVALCGDPVRLSQAIANLLNNAARYTPTGGRIRLSAIQEEATVVIRVRDSGIGITPHMLTRIFDMFVQADNSSGHARGGMGVGLALVRRLVELHGGSVQARSDGPGRGSEFVVRLPTQVPAQHRAAAQHGSEVAAAATTRSAAVIRRRRVLVVDDNVDVATSLAMLLRMSGQDVMVVHDGPSALAAAQAHQPEVVLLDLGMPGMDGFDVARRMRRLPAMENVRLVALTGWGQEETRTRSAEAGFDQHLVKPIGLEALEQVLALS